MYDVVYLFIRLCFPDSVCVWCYVSGGAGRGQGQHVWGAGGQRLVGEILDNVVLPHQIQDPRQLAGRLSHIS